MPARLLLAALLLAIAASHARAADTIVLNDGSKSEGTVVEETNDTVILKVKFGNVTYQKREIKEIVRGGAAAPAPAADASGLRDVVVLKNGEEHSGLLVSEGGGDIEFDLVMSGKTVSKTIMSRTTFKSAEVAELRKLTDAQRADARKSLVNAAAQAKEEVAAEQQIKVEPHTWPLQKGGTAKVAKVELDFFTIESNTSEDFLKRAAFRLNKVFNAYKQHFGTDRKPPVKVRVMIFNSMGEYLASINNAVQNPAFYVPDLKLICAGCDYAGYEKAIAEIRVHHKRLDDQLRMLRLQVSDARQKINAAVAKAYEQVNASGKGATAQGQAALEQVKSQQRQWQVEIGEFEKQIVAVQGEIAAINRRNDVFFSDYTKQMFAVLYHEGFHAFLDNVLFEPGQSKLVPRWLNEGLAQYFEVSRIENDRLILGQEDRERMAILRQFRSQNALLPIDKVVAGDAKDYLVHSFSNLETSTKNYMQSWLLVHHLGEKGRLTRDNLQAFVKDLGAGKAPLAALQTLAGTPPTEVETAMQEKLKPKIAAEDVKK